MLREESWKEVRQMQMEQVGEYPHVNYIDRRSDPDTESHTDVNNTKKLSVSSVP